MLSEDVLKLTVSSMFSVILVNLQSLLFENHYIHFKKETAEDVETGRDRRRVWDTITTEKTGESYKQKKTTMTRTCWDFSSDKQ